MTKLMAAFAVLVAGAWWLGSAEGPVWTRHDKAFYADPALVNFVRPGLDLRILSAEIALDGTIRVRFRITDPRGLGLDRLGVTTPGEVTVRAVAGALPPGRDQYVSYVNRTVTSPITNRSAVQPTADTGGTFQQVGEGEYIYTFAARAPANIDRGATHSIGMWANRNLAEFEMDTIANADSEVFHFVPSGGAVGQVRDLIRTETCNKCHDPIQAHDNRRTMQLCVMCHTDDVIDPDTGNDLDMEVMIHKIHAGAFLPSVRQGGRYQIIGFQQSVHDYSTVAFPAGASAETTISGTRNCIVCHERSRGAAQASKWLTEPSRDACGSCHDDVNFATGEKHANLPQVSDNQCSTCHTPQGELEFDVSILGAHTVPELSAALPGVVFDILAVDGAAPGARPTITFSVKDDKGNAVRPADTTRLALVVGGATRDYARYFSEDVRRAEGTADGRYFWTLETPLPADARGTWSVGIEGYRNQTLLAGTQRQRTVRDAGVNVVRHFPVTDRAIEPRRQVVTNEKCNACHSFLTVHGNNRNRVEHCVICHNANENDAARRPAAQAPPATVDFRTMIHRIHTGHELEFDYTVYGFGGIAYNYNHVGFPGDRRNCNVCHVNDSQQLPLPEGLRPVNDPRGLLTPTPPESAACLGCHTARFAAAHAAANVAPNIGESCAACHGEGREFSVNRVHAR